MPNLYVISLGGSLINPSEVDSTFLKSFKKLILEQTSRGNRFIIIAGGGKLCRNYQEALTRISKPGKDDLDWMGIFTTWTNAQLVRLMFGKSAHPKIVTDPNKKVPFKEKILVGGGWMPGRSTDDDAVRLAKIYGAKTIINLSNIDFVYTKDPRKFKDAAPILETTWADFKKVIGTKRIPGGNYPFDPVAAAFAQKNNISAIITNGKNLSNLKNILTGKKYSGTTIR
jgi:uridylate kinase